MKKNRRLPLLLVTALLLGGLGLLYVADAAPEYHASASNGNEHISLRAAPLISKPNAWTLAWRVGAAQVNTVNVGIQVQTAGTNVVNPRLTYYVKAVCQGNSRQVVRGGNVSVSLGGTFSNSTGSISIDSHLQSLGVSVTQDQTVTYYVYARLTAQGAISGRTLTAEIAETHFSTVVFDYGAVTTVTQDYIAVADAYVVNTVPYSNYGTYPSMQIFTAYETYTWTAGYVKFNVSTAGTVQSATLYVYAANPMAIPSGFGVYTTGNNWAETGITWDNRPGAGVRLGGIGVRYGQWYSLTVTGGVPSTAPFTVSFCFMDAPDGWDYAVVVDTRESSNKPYLRVTMQTINWAASWSWANQPLSLIAVPAARLMVAASLFGFAALLLASGRRGKAAYIAAFTFMLLGAALFTGAAHAAQQVQPMPIRDEWRAGDLAVYLQSFPFPAVDYVNGTVIEKPAEVHGDLTVSLAVFNASEMDPVKIAVDGEDVWTLQGEGFYMLQAPMEPGVHSITVYSSLKVFEQAVFYVKPKPVTPLMPLEEFLAKLEQQRNEIVTRMLIAAAAGVPAGIFLKKRTKIKTGWVMPLPGAAFTAGYVYMPTLYMLLPFAATMTLAYWLCPDFARWVYMAKLSGDSVDLNVKLPMDGDEAILAISPRHWRHGFMLKKRVELVESAADLLGDSVARLTINDESFDCVILDPDKPIEHLDGVIRIHGKPALKKALLEAGIVEAQAKELSRTLKENIVLREEVKSMAVHSLSRLHRALASPVEKIVSSTVNSLTSSRLKEEENGKEK